MATLSYFITASYIALLDRRYVSCCAHVLHRLWHGAHVEVATSTYKQLYNVLYIQLCCGLETEYERYCILVSAPSSQVSTLAVCSNDSCYSAPISGECVSYGVL